MKKKLELLAPGGDIDSIKAAIIAGADAVYCGLDHFNARNRATNISFDDLNGIINIAHQHHCQIFLTLNIIILEREIPALLRLLNKLVNTKIDGLIVQDLGLFYLLLKYFPSFARHASTQVTTHNHGQIQLLNKLGVSRVNLSRELNLKEIKSLTAVAHKNNMLSEVFVHGSNCIGFSGLCYLSSVQGGNSGNRGRCSQPCRDQYLTTRAGKDFPLNLKDNSAFLDLQQLHDSGIDSVKIEGRVKKSHYVYTVVDSWRKQLHRFYHDDALSNDNRALYKVFNRDFSNAFLQGDINKNMFIDSPRDHSVNHFINGKGNLTDSEIELLKQQIYTEKTIDSQGVNEKLKALVLAKTPLSIDFSGDLNLPLSVTINTADNTFLVTSDSDLILGSVQNIDEESLIQRFSSLTNSQYQIDQCAVDNLQQGLFLPFKELTKIKNKLAYLLNDSIDIVKPVTVPTLNRQNKLTIRAGLSVLISSINDVHLCSSDSAKIYYQLPDCINNQCFQLIQLFLNNKQLIPWFPAILIGEDYGAAGVFLDQVKPKSIVTNNLGIAFLADEKGINWIAGPHLNITNSYSLLAMQELFNCSGSFISNEINKKQIEAIVCPENFNLYYSIYHPILLLSSRQCLFFQTSGCKKAKMDLDCLPNCKKSTSIINLKATTFIINKNRDQYNCMYSNINFLNTQIITDQPNVFSSYFIDLREIKTDTKRPKSKTEVLQLFNNLLAGYEDSETKLKQVIYPTLDEQYSKGL